MRNNKDKNKKKNKEKYLTILIYALVIVAVIIAISAYIIIQNKEKEENIAYTDFIRDIDEGKIEEIEMTVRKFNIKGNIQRKRE